MQTTLLSIAIALILALLAALVGPHFVDWNTYRGAFETRASQLTGLDVRILGPIEARLLPTPSVTLRRIDVARAGEAGSLQARRLDIEFALGSLVRGEWKATVVRIDGAELAVGMDSNGRPDWPAPTASFDPNTISIERLDVRDGRVLMADAASGSSAVLDRFEFKGEVRTLAGPLKGQGSFYLDGQHFPYRVAATPTGTGGGVRVRLIVDPIDMPLTAEADTVVTIEDGVPRYDGSLQFARPVGRAKEGATAEIVEPWRLGGRIKGDSKAATIEQVEFQYGPDERAIKLRGNAQLTFGRSPVLTTVLSSPQVDLDRILALPDAERGRPGTAIKAFADQFASRHRLPIPVELGISIDTLTLAGAALQRVAGDLRSTPDGWNLQTLEFRAPGLTQAQFSGRLGIGGERLSFAGRTRIESKDPRALMAWLTDRTDAQAIAATNLFIDGEVKLGNDAIAVDRLRAELDRMRLEGSVAYLWATSERPARIEAAVRAPEIDIDRTYALMQGLLAGTAFDWPREGELRAIIGRASFGGVEANRADVNMRFNGHGIEIDRLAIGDFGGAALAIKGRIDTREQSPTGALTLELTAKRLNGVTALLERVSPQAAAELHRNAKRFAPAKLRGTLAVTGPADTPDANATGAFKIEGAAGAFEVALSGDFDASRDDLTIANLARLKVSRLGLDGRIAAADGGALLSLLGLDRLVSTARGRGRMEFNAKGPLDGEMAITAQILAGDLDATANGNVRLAGSQGPTAGLELKVATANLIAPRVPGRPAEMLPLAMTSRLALAEGVIRLTDISGKIAGTDVSGRLRVGFGQPLAVNGELSLGAIAMPAGLAAAVGVPQGKGNAWSTEPFERGLIGSLEGQVTMRLGTVSLSPTLRARNVRAVARFESEQLSLEDIDGTFADGRIAGGLTFQRNDDGIAAQGHLRFAGADFAEMLQGGALTGRVTLDLDVEGTGRSPTALIGALKGSGTFTFQDGKIERFDPSAFEAVMRAVEQGLTIDAQRVGERMETALGNGALHVGLAQGELMLAAGQLRLANTVVRAKGAELALRASIGLADSVIDARMTLTGPPHGNALGGAPPQVGISLRGPLGSPKRTLDATQFSNWLAMRAIEEKAKRIDALETGKELPAPPPAAPQAQPQPTVTPTPQSAPQPDATPAPAPRAAAPTGQPVTQPPAAQTKKPPAVQAPKATPPVDIRPPAAAARAQQTAPNTAAKPKPEPKAAARPIRSWLENLLGP